MKKFECFFPKKMLEFDPVVFLEWLSLATKVGVFLLVFTFLLVGIRLFGILGAVREITTSVAEIIETVNTVLWQPVRFFSSIFGTLKKFLRK